METKAWYKSKLVITGLLTFGLGGLESIMNAMNSVSMDKNSMALMIIGLLTAWLRKYKTNTVVQ